MIANPSKPTGTVDSCIEDAQAVIRAGVVAKRMMEEQLGAAYTRFVVHTLECQVTGSGMIFKAAVSATHPITGGRDSAHVTYLEHLAGSAPDDASYDPVSLVGVSPDGGFSEGEDGGAANASNSAIGDGMSAISGTSRRRSLQTTPTGPTYTLLDQSIVSGPPPAEDKSFSTVITNQDALKDPFLELIGLRASGAVVLTAVIIVGTFLLALLLYTAHYVFTHSHIMSHLRDHWHHHERVKDVMPSVLMHHAGKDAPKEATSVGVADGPVPAAHGDAAAGGGSSRRVVPAVA